MRTPTVNLLEAQLPFEADAASLYQRLWEWCDKQALPGCASFFKAEHREERHHLRWIIDYVNDYFDELLAVPAVSEHSESPPSLMSAFQRALAVEREQCDRLNKLYDQVEEQPVGDHITCARLLKKLLIAQAKSIEDLTYIVRLLTRASDDPAAILRADKIIGKMT